jgi:hypothetical protein
MKQLFGSALYIFVEMLGPTFLYIKLKFVHICKQNIIIFKKQTVFKQYKSFIQGIKD